MKLYRTSSGYVVEEESQFHRGGSDGWDSLITRGDLYEHLKQLLPGLERIEAPDDLLPPIGSQEVWAAGVTYYRSRDARMEESKSAGGGDFYDRVYAADRPELFFKATPHRVVGHGGQVAIRSDAKWSVPEPELTLLISPGGKIIGYTIGNDMSSRDIEGENPLYLPQAKVYDRSCALGPCILVQPGRVAKDDRNQAGDPAVWRHRIQWRYNAGIAKARTRFAGGIPLSEQQLSTWLFLAYRYRHCAAGCVHATARR